MKQFGYKISEDEHRILKRIKYQGTYFHPVKDINGSWFIFEEEFEHCILYFALKLTRAEFIPALGQLNPDIPV